MKCPKNAQKFLYSNFGVIKCIKLFFSPKGKIQNIGFMVFTMIIIGHIPEYIFYFIDRINPVKNYLKKEMENSGYITKEKENQNKKNKKEAFENKYEKNKNHKKHKEKKEKEKPKKQSNTKFG